MLDFGQMLFSAYELCIQCHAHFDDYVDRKLGLHRANAKSIIKVNNLDINPKIGFENMKTVASIKDEDERKEAVQAFLSGQSPDMVKAQFTARQSDDEDMDPLEYLMAERDKLEKSVENILIKISKLDNKIDEMKNKIEEQEDNVPELMMS